MPPARRRPIGVNGRRRRPLHLLPPFPPDAFRDEPPSLPAHPASAL